MPILSLPSDDAGEAEDASGDSSGPIATADASPDALPDGEPDATRDGGADATLGDSGAAPDGSDAGTSD